MDEKGIIYIGGKDEFGFLAPGPNGSLQYNSLINHLEKNKRNFGDVWKTHWTAEGIYFRTSRFLFHLDSNSRQIKEWGTDYLFKGSYTWKGKLFIIEQNTGLNQMDTASDSLQLVPGGEIFANEVIHAMFPYND